MGVDVGATPRTLRIKGPDMEANHFFATTFLRDPEHAERICRYARSWARQTPFQGLGRQETSHARLKIRSNPQSCAAKLAPHARTTQEHRKFALFASSQTACKTQLDVMGRKVQQGGRRQLAMPQLCVVSAVNSAQRANADRTFWSSAKYRACRE